MPASSAMTAESRGGILASRFARWWLGSLLLVLIGWQLSPELGVPLRRAPVSDSALLALRALPAPSRLDEADLLRIRTLRLTMDEDGYTFLFSRPPLSHTSFQDVQALFDDRRKPVRCRFRVRGGHSWHWLREKPSFRLRFSSRRTIWNRETLDFINPEDAALQANLLADFLAQRVGVPAAVTRFIDVRLNDRPLGLYHVTDRLDDHLFDHLGRPRQPIAEGNRRQAGMWRAPSLWDIHSSRPAMAEACRKALGELLESIRPPVSPTGIRDLGQRIDLPALASWSALLTVIGSLQADDLHNQDLAYDTVSGRFTPLLVDSTGFGALTNLGLLFAPADSRIWPNEFLTPITNAAFRNPFFLASRNRAIHGFLTGEAHPLRIASLSNRLFEAARSHLEADPNLGALVNIPHLEFPLRLPISAKTVAAAVDGLNAWYASRTAYLEELLGSCSVRILPVQVSPPATTRLFWIEVDGHVPVEWDLASLPTLIRYDHDADRAIDETSPAASPTLRLFPGLREGLPPNQPWLRLETRMLPFALLPASQGYLLAVAEPSWPACLDLLTHGARNGVTGKACVVTTDSELPEPPDYPVTAGLHPWALPASL